LEEKEAERVENQERANDNRSTKRYFFSVVEEAVMNPDYKGYSGGRIEVFDRENKSGHAIYEACFLMPTEFMENFRNVFDWKESNLMPYIVWRAENEK